MRTLLPFLVAVALVACSGEPTTLVKPRPYTAGVRPVLAAGEHRVDIGLSGSSFFGRETSRDLLCVAEAGDPAVTVLRMRLLRLEPEGPVLVAHTEDVPATGPMMFEYDVRDVPVGTAFSLKVEFVRADGTSEVREMEIASPGPLD